MKGCGIAKIDSRPLDRLAIDVRSHEARARLQQMKIRDDAARSAGKIQDVAPFRTDAVVAQNADYGFGDQPAGFEIAGLVERTMHAIPQHGWRRAMGGMATVLALIRTQRVAKHQIVPQTTQPVERWNGFRELTPGRIRAGRAFHDIRKWGIHLQRAYPRSLR